MPQLLNQKKKMSKKSKSPISQPSPTKLMQSSGSKKYIRFSVMKTNSKTCSEPQKTRTTLKIAVASTKSIAKIAEVATLDKPKEISKRGSRNIFITQNTKFQTNQLLLTTFYKPTIK